MNAWFMALATNHAPTVHPQVHYIPSSASNLERAVRYCLDHDAQCEQMAARMRQTMLSVARVEEVEEYTFLLLRRLQAWAETPPAAVL